MTFFAWHSFPRPRTRKGISLQKKVTKSVVSSVGGYVYFETSYKAVNRVFSSAALESGNANVDGSPIRVHIFDDSSGAGGSFTTVNTSTSGGHLIENNTNSLGNRGGASHTLFKSALSISNLDSVSIESSFIPAIAHLISPNITVPGPQGLCFNFHYNLDGLSAEKLRILIRDVESETNSTIWESASETEGKWIRAAVAYSYESPHQVKRQLVLFSSVFFLLPQRLCLFTHCLFSKWERVEKSKLIVIFSVYRGEVCFPRHSSTLSLCRSLCLTLCCLALMLVSRTQSTA